MKQRFINVHAKKSEANLFVERSREITVLLGNMAASGDAPRRDRWRGLRRRHVGGYRARPEGEEGDQTQGKRISKSFGHKDLYC